MRSTMWGTLEVWRKNRAHKNSIGRCFLFRSMLRRHLLHRRRVCGIFFLLFRQHSRRSCGSVSTWNAAAYAHWALHASTVGCGLRWSVSRAMPSIDLGSTVSKIVFHLKLLCVRIVFIISIVRKHSVCAHLFHLSKFLLNVLFSPSLYNIFLRQSIVFNINFLNGCCLLNGNRKEMKYVVSRHAFVWFRHSAVLFSDAYPLS